MIKTQYFVCKTMMQIDWLCERLNTMPEWAYDSETHGTFLNGYVFVMSFSWAAGVAACIDFRYFTDEEQAIVWDKLAPVFANDARKVTQNGVYDIKFLWNYGLAFNNWYADTILEDHLLDENNLHGLEHLTNRYVPELSGYHAELDKYVVDHPECNPAQCLVEDTKKKKKKKGDVEDVSETEPKTKWRNLKIVVKQGHKILDVGSYTRIPRDMLHQYACQDADVTYRVHCVMLPKIYEQRLDFMLFDIQMPTQVLLAEVEFSGVTVDNDVNAALLEEYKTKMDASWDKIINDAAVKRVIEHNRQPLLEKYDKSKRLKREYTRSQYLEAKRKDWEFKVSTKSLEQLMIHELNQSVIEHGTKLNKKTGKFNVSMKKSVMDEYAKRVPLAAKIQEHRGYQHLNGTFIAGLRLHINKYDNRIRTNYPLHRVVTGRPSSFSPNLNNIPRKAVEIKYQFVADPGDILVEADYSQIEFRVWAHYSQDPQMISDINAGLDIHKLTAGMGKGLQIPLGAITFEQFMDWTANVSKEERQLAKTVVFGMMYGRGPRSVAEEFSITVEEARNIRRLFFMRYPVAERWLNDTKQEAKRMGYVTNIYGRKRRLPILKTLSKRIEALQREADRQAQDEAWGTALPEAKRLTPEKLAEKIQDLRDFAAKAERKAVNSPIQGGASDTLFLAAVRIRDEMQRLGLESRLVLTVYDSIIYTVKSHELETLLQVIHTEMLRDTGWLRVALGCEIKVGRVWGKLKEIAFDTQHVPDPEMLTTVLKLVA